YMTTNGGIDWEKIYQFDSLFFEQIQFLNEKTGWIAGSPNKLFKTENGGINWTDKSISSEMENAFIYGMYFKDIEHGYLAVINRNESGFFSNIYSTNNGGEDWQLVNSLEEMILNLEEIDNSIYGTGHNVIIKDIDKGDRWKYFYRDTSKQVGQIRDIEVNETGKIRAVSFNGYVIECTEEKFNIERITNNRIRNLISFNRDSWIAVGDTNIEPGNLFMSSNNGRNWLISKRKFPDIHRINKSENRLWVVGKAGLMMTRGI
ncbi:WD40/YVTN/BNR-like repeat-containing protein, partial [Bacteroidota bacterium]